ncbi:ester cyclase [Streptomyces sp. NPDC042319]|uniref:ester cyclase n=1 Tax=Streptomyces sp. NPDC042319 TaxID=3154332 RepID=UPI0033E23CA3
MSAEQNRSLYKKWIDELWHADPEKMDDLAEQLAAPDFVAHWPGEDVSGPVQLAEMVRRGVSLFSEVRVDVVVGPLAENDLVSGRWIFRGKYNGELPGSPATVGTEVSFAGMDIFRCRDGKFTEYWVSSDGLQFMEQLGFTPKP